MMLAPAQDLRVPRFGYLGVPLLLRGLEEGALDYTRHRRVHGSPPMVDLRQLLELSRSVNLAGRGGAGFAVATKLDGLRQGRRVVVVNGTESEPASFKDRLLLTMSPHLVLDGAEVVANAIRSRDVRIAVHDEGVASGLRQALAERDKSVKFRISVIGGGFVAGEARSVIRALSGGPAVPPGRRVLPTHQGVGGKPTFLSNAETFAQIAVLARLGANDYARQGTGDEPGTTLLTVNGAVGKAGVYEVPLGTSVATLLNAALSRPVAGLAIGGYHGAWLSPQADILLSRRGLAKVGGTLGAGVVSVIDDTTCALGELARVATWLATESAGQCGPCTFGLPALANDVIQLMRGKDAAVRALQHHAQLVTGRGACAHPDGAARFLSSGLLMLERDIDTHRRHGNCGRPIVGQLQVGRPGAR